MAVRRTGPSGDTLNLGIGGKLALVLARLGSGVIVKKGRHRRFEEARDLKRAVSTDDESTGEPCPECGADPGKEHASWCLATEDDDDVDDDDDEESAQYEGQYNPSDTRH
jgi:hypothetical protein